VHDDLCAVADEHGRTRHVFAADAPNQLWLTDITEHKPLGFQQSSQRSGLRDVQ
jgi:hypothetical protein